MILLVTGSRTFCEATPDKSRDDYMDERRALGFALDWIKPDAIVTDGKPGAGRWAAIWAERRGVPVSSGQADECVVFPGGYEPDLPTYRVTL